MTRRPALAIALLVGCTTPGEEPEPGCPDSMIDDAGACVPEACGLGDYGDAKSGDGPFFHVHPEGDRDGDGSEGAPFDRIQDAAGAASEDSGTVVVAAGTYDRNLAFDSDHDGVVVRGRCAEMVIIEPREDGVATVDHSAGELDLRYLTIRRGTPALQVGVYGLSATVDLRLDDVVIEDGEGFGILAYGTGTVIDASDTTVRNTGRDATGDWGYGVVIGAGPTLLGRRLVIDGNIGTGIVVDQPSSRLEIEDSTIGGTVTFGGVQGLGFARGIAIQGGASMVGTGLTFLGDGEASMYVAQAGSQATVSDSTFTSSELRLEDGRGGRGIDVGDGGRLIGSDLTFDGSAEMAIFAYGSNTEVFLTDSVIRNTTPDLNGTLGRAINIQWGASLEASGLQIEGNRNVSLMSDGDGTEVFLEDSVITETGRDARAGGGKGIVAQLGGDVVATNVTVTDGTGPGLFLTREGSAQVTDCELTGNGFAAAVVHHGDLDMVGGTLGGSTRGDDFGGGVGLFAWDLTGEPTVRLDGVFIADTVGPGLYLRGPGTYELIDVDIESTGAVTDTAAGLVAMEGVTPWDEATETGLRIESSTFRDLEGDALLLDDSGATLDGASFESVEGMAAWLQHCAEEQPLVVLSGEADDNGCEGWARELDPRLRYLTEVAEADVSR